MPAAPWLSAIGYRLLIGMARSTAEILKKIRRLEIRTRKIVETAFSGEYHSVFRGHGMNFEEFRQYQIGDEIRAIDWRVTARMGDAYVRKYVEERELTILLLVDVSASGVFGTTSMTKRELAGEVACLLAFCAVNNNDNVGLLLFTDKTELYIPPRKGRSHALRIIREVLFFEPENRGTDLINALEFVNRVANRKAVVFLFSDFQNLDFERAASVCSKRHDLIAVPIEDPGEWQLPPAGLVRIEDPETGQTFEANFSSKKVQREFARIVSERRDRRDAIFRRQAIDFLPLSTDKDYFPILHSFFQHREQRLKRGG
jgi:uncharacterized protein (DUF58 family)